MTDQNNSAAAAENPEIFTGLHLGPVKTSAAGLPAVLSSFRHIVAEAGWIRGLQALGQVNQKTGFDCPGCAWPDPDDERSGLAEYCENGAKAVAEEATLKRIGADFFASHSVVDLARLSDYEIGKKGRIAQPVYLPEGGRYYEPISWTDAFQKIADQLHRLDTPDQAVFYTSGRTSNEAAFLYQLFVRCFGTNNLPDCSNMCHESSGVALTEALGIGKGSVTLDDFNHAEVIIIMGQNPGTNHPRMLTALEKAKKNGAQIVSINPIPETGLMGFRHPQHLKGMLGINTPLTDLFLPVRINGDLAILQALNALLLEAEVSAPGRVLDQEFIQSSTEGFDTYSKHLKALDPESLAASAGVTVSEIHKLADLLKYRKRIIVCWAMGLTQHKNAVSTIREIVNLLLLKGSIGIRGGGTCPVRGHSNVQGDRTMGIYEKPSEAFLNAIGKYFRFDPPRSPGYDVVESIHAMHRGDVKVFMAMGGNFLSASPDTQYTADALRNCSLTVHVSTKLNRTHLVHGKASLILPCLGRSDQDLREGTAQLVSCENSMGVVQLSKGNLKPVSDQLLSEPAIVCRLAATVLGKQSSIDWSAFERNYDNIRTAIAATIPGFEHYNERLRNPGGFYLPNCSREGRFETPDQKAHFHVAQVEAIPLKEGELIMMTIRSHDQFNTTIYGLDDRYRGIFQERRVILMNEKDIEHQQLSEGEIVDLYNTFEGVERVARQFLVVPYPIPQGCAATYFPEANVLVPIHSVAEKSNTPTSKAVVIRVKKRDL